MPFISSSFIRYFFNLCYLFAINELNDESKMIKFPAIWLLECERRAKRIKYAPQRKGNFSRILNEKNKTQEKLDDDGDNWY